MMEMFHSGTPESVKKHILDNISRCNGHTRVIACTIAFGMGVNCKGVHRVVHFGPAKILNAMFRNVEEQEGMGSQVHVFCCTMDCWQHIVHVTSRTTCPTIKNAGELLFIVIFQENSPLPCQVTSAVIFVQGAAGVGKKAAVSRLLCLWNLMLMTHPLKV